MKKISIVTATYNSGATIRDTLESVLRQTYPNVEHIVVDGGSNDCTMDVVREYEPRYGGRLRYVSEPDKGIYDAMNKGIAMATGDVVGLLNSDDFFTCDDVVSRIAATFEAADVDAVYGDIHYVHEGDLKKCTRYYSSKLFHRRWLRFGFMPAHPSFYCHKRVYDQYGGFDLSFKIAADFDCVLRFIFVHRIKTKYIPMDFVTMRTGGASTSGISSHKQILRDHQRAFKKYGIFSNELLESLRYVYKVCEIVATKASLLK